MNVTCAQINKIMCSDKRAGLLYSESSSGTNVLNSSIPGYRPGYHQKLNYE